ncbi:TonB-dependent siderophore receptor [Vaginella massiliensis]|uniref:TonB-dependent siderophore receptor n=1 Tax=Vaginella massiliensis TaxID=1816680 RepID=UPI003751F475
MRRNKILLTTIALISLHSVYGQEINDSVRNLDQVEVFGDRNRNQRGLETITRFPASPQSQVQSISVISEKLIEEQGALTVTDITRNVPGVTLFSSYGGVRESMSIRGYRGVPVLKNGVRMESDFRTSSAVIDMAGVESIQVIRGTAALTQGIGNSLGSAGGVINVTTKTPRFTNGGSISARYGSWNNIRTTFDAQQVLTNSNNLAVRLTGAYQRGDSYRDVVSNNSFYINPSLAWRIDNKTEFVAEMDYYKGERTPDRGTVNLADNFTEALYDMGSKFTGFDIDNNEVKNFSYAGRITRKLTNNISARVAYFYNNYNSDQLGATLSAVRGSTQYNLRNRGLGHSFKDDRNATLQIDLMGTKMSFGNVNWSWQVGYDYTFNRVDTRSATGIATIDQIDVLQPINNHITLTPEQSELLNWDPEKTLLTKGYSYGFMTQHHIDFYDLIKLVGGVRYSYSIDYHDEAIDPTVGLMITPNKNISIYSSYATNTSLRSALNPMRDGSMAGPSVTNQFEVGVKTQWLNDRLRANVVYFNMNNENLTYQWYDQGVATGLYEKAGNLRRKGVEVEIAGRPLPNVQVMLGYAYLDAGYENSPQYVDGSRPMNAPYNTGSAWVQYRFQNNALEGLTAALGFYYVGERPANDQSYTRDAHGTWYGGNRPFSMPDYYTLNAQLGYSMKKFDFRLFFNNITDQIGYSSYYRGGFINQNDPFNIAGQVVFKF